MTDIDTTGCVGNTIITASGRYFDYLNPLPGQIDINDIAQALGNTCRFGGHSVFYSVAEHCVHCCNQALSEGLGNDVAFHALMHDAAEAYVGDMPKPLKNLLPAFIDIERRVECAIAYECGLTDDHHEIVKKIDLALLKAEKLFLFASDKEKWEGFTTLPYLDIDFELLTPREAAGRFISCFVETSRDA